MKRSVPILLLLAVFVLPVHAGGQRGGIGGAGGYGGTRDPFYSRAKADYQAVWRGLQLNTDRLLKNIGATNAEAALLLRQMQTNATFLESRWNAWFNSHIERGQYATGDAYLASLRADSRLLGDLRKEKDGQKALGLLRDAALDLQIKADNCRHSKDGLGKEIKVKVHTKAGDKEVGGYQVFYVPKAMIAVKNAHVRFPRQSSPTDPEILSPGAYAMWVARKAFTSEPTTVRIGGQGKLEVAVDIEVPPE